MAQDNLTGPEILKIILAIVGILILVGLAVMLYNFFSDKHELEQAKASLSKLSANLDGLLKNKVQTETDVLIESPNKWSISAWPYGGFNEKPIKCLTEYCICFCPKPLISSHQNYLDNCNEKGTCMYVSNKTNVLPEPIKISGPISINVKLINNEIYIVENKNEEEP